MSTLDINYTLLISYVGLFDTDAYKAAFRPLKFILILTLDYVRTVAPPSSEKIKKRTELKFSWRNSALKEFQFLKRENVALCKLAVEQIH